MTKAAHSALLRSVRPRADQCCTGTNVTAAPPGSATRSPQSCASAAVALAWVRMMVSLPSGANTRGRMDGGEAGQRRQIEVVVVAMRDQHGVDRRQGLESD